MNLLSRMSMAAKVKAAQSVLGVTNAEMTMLDKYVAKLSAHPLSSTLLGAEVRDVSELATLAMTEGSSLFSKNIDIIHRVLHDEAMRHGAGEVLASCLPKEGAQRKKLINVLMKVVNSPLGSNVPDEFDDVPQIFSKGLLPMAAEYVELPEHEEPPKIVKCRFCHEPFKI